MPDVSSKWGNIALGNWPGYLLSQLEHMEEMNFNVLKEVYSKRFGLSVRRSTIPKAGYGVFGTRNIKKGEIVGWYNSALVYRDINTRSSSMAKVYGPRFLCVWLAVLRNMVYSFSTSSTDHHGLHSSTEILRCYEDE
jgi:hypothetical protein